ncbi:MAG: tRNA (adenosine(37)-N6)-threonylcarbamoyltransferase complex ATPase subunit type 1 TsaE [Patescibacteria group bacterium]
MRYLSQKPKETIAFAKRVASRLRGGDVVVFAGGLGSGKTTFMKGVAKFFCIRQVIQSPTFVIAKVYRLKRNTARARATHLLHIDAYRIMGRTQLSALGLDDLIGAPGVITCIENPKRLFRKSDYTHRIALQLVNPERRLIVFQ